MFNEERELSSSSSDCDNGTSFFKYLGVFYHSNRKQRQFLPCCEGLYHITVKQCWGLDSGGSLAQPSGQGQVTELVLASPGCLFLPSPEAPEGSITDTRVRTSVSMCQQGLDMSGLCGAWKV